MATGQQAFTFRTDRISPLATLQGASQDSREFPRLIPYRLERIIRKATAREPENRYQTAAQIREELQALRHSSAFSRAPRWKIIASVAALGTLITGTALWITTRRGAPGAVHEFQQRQLTVNSSENPVTGGAISPDGKYIVYSDLKGIYLKRLGSGATREISLPVISERTRPNWEIDRWLPDSTRFFAIAELPLQPSSLWGISATGGAHRRLAEGANPWGISPDGLLLAITRNKDREIWLIGTNGEHPRKIYESRDGSHFRAVQWSPDGNRLGYIKITPHSGAQIELGDSEGSQPTVLLSGAETRPLSLLADGFRDMSWLSDGRLIYVGGEQDIHGMSCNLFEARIDNRTGRLLAKPHQLTNWAGFCVTTFSATADGKKLAFDKSSDLLTVYMAAFDAAKLRLSTPHRLTFTDDLSSPAGWTPDSTAVFVRSNREGSWGIYRQPISGASSEAAVTGLADVSWTTPVSPDGKWLLYGFSEPSQPTQRWMRRPLSGGPSAEVAKNINGVLCPRISAAGCIAAERTANSKEIVFRELDPITGVGRELARFRNENAEAFGFDLSSDGGMLVLFRQFGNQLQVLPLRHDLPVREIQVKGEVHVRTISWAPDSKGWFASNQTQQGADLLYIDLHGNTHHLWHLDGYNIFLWGRPSPDGHHVAIQGSAGNSNMWMMENF